MTARNAVAWLLRLIGAALLIADAASGQIVRVPPIRTVATLGACTDTLPKIVAVTDGATATDCATGSGTYDVTCYCANGAWSAAAAANGTVTTVSVSTANGVSGTVANATTTPALTIALGAITPTSVAAVGSVTGSNLSGTNTGDQTNISGNAATATALQATLGVAGGGTGATSLTAYAPVCGGTTSTGAAQSCSTGIDTSGYVLTSNGPSALPSWQAASGGGAAGSDTQVTFNNAGTAAGDSGLTFNATTNTLTASGVNIGTIAAGQGLEANGYALPYVRLIGYDSDMWIAANKLTLTSGSGRFGELTHDRLGFGRDTCLAFFNHPDPAQGSADSGFCRSSPGILWATDGSSGVGFWRDVPTDSPPACADAARGVHYFDDSLGEECSCKGASGAASWQQMDGGGAC